LGYKQFVHFELKTALL